MAETESPPAPPSSGNQSVQLGVGTLIIIAVIVSMCSGNGEVQKLRGDINQLKQQNTEINQKLDTLLQKSTNTTGQ